MLTYLIIVLAVLSRFIPHMPNFAPITALAIFSAAYLPWKKALSVTFAARFISDLFIGFVSWPMMLAIYFAHLSGMLLGLWIKRARKHKWIKIAASPLAASGVFFLITNFAFLYSNYPHNFFGIVQAYMNGLPFLKGTLLGDGFYTFALFGGYEIAQLVIRKKLFTIFAPHRA